MKYKQIKKTAMYKIEKFILEGNESNIPLGNYCKICNKKIISNEIYVFLSRGLKSRTGIRFHGSCFHKFVDDIKKISNEELDLLEKELVIGNL